MNNKKIFFAWITIITIVGLLQPYFEFWPNIKTSDNFFNGFKIVEAGCSNECAYIGQTNGDRICGNYDSDPCLEWSDIEDEIDDDSPGGGGIDCDDECAYIGQHCANGGICGDYDSDPCLECSPPPSCTDECSYIGQKRCSNSTHYQVCGNYDSDACLEWSSSYYCGSGKVCSNGNCISQCISHDHKACYNNDVYWYNSCNQREGKFQECGSTSSWSNWTYACSDNKVYKTRSRTVRGCSNASCYSRQETDTQFVEDCSQRSNACGYGNCSDTQRPVWSCSNGQCVYTCVESSSCCASHAYKQCYNNDVYWYNSCGNREEKVNECGTSGWVNNYKCSGNYLQREWINRGCSNASCFANSEWKNYQNCGSDSWTDNYRCSGNWVQRQKHKKGCANNSCYDYYQWENYQNCSDLGKVCQNGQCVLGCEDECSYIGQKRCSDSGHYQVCGDYDNDPCLEWSSSHSCGSDACIGSTWRNYYCTGWGICTYTDTSCSPNCYSCGDGTCNSECGESSTNCPEDCGYPELSVTCSVNPNPAQINQLVTFTACPSGGTGTYTYLWSGACSNNQQNCSTSFNNPGNYSATVTVTSGNQTKSTSCSVTVEEPQCECTAWSDWQNQGCGQGGCSSTQMYQIRTRDCYPDGCASEQESRCIESSACQPQNDPVSGTLSVNSTSVCVGNTISITISGQDDDGLSGFYVYYQGNWHWQSASGTSDTKTWSIVENTAGVYTYCGQVFGYKPDGTTETANTSPYCVNVKVSSCEPSCTNECSYIGQTRCYNYNHRQICGNYDSDSCLEWSQAELCTGPTNCGYGTCASNQRPNWYCSNGTCTYTCSYDSSCEISQNYLGCYNDDVWWYSPQGSLLTKYQECGDDYCSNWGSRYCVGNKVYQQRTCYNKGCSNGACYSISYTDTKLVRECGPNQTCQNGQCVSECECSSGPCCDGCHYKPSTTICDVEVQTQYGCPWGLGCGADVGKRTKSRFRYCTGDSSQCTGRWSDWGNWTTWLVADYCTTSEVCRVGQQKCQYNSSCVRPTPPPYIIHYTKGCYDNDLYWFDSNGARQDKYRDCEDKNECTLDLCINGRCQNELKCDGSTCIIGSADYCQSCNHCGDGICNCEENICSCPKDCKITGLSLSLLVKKEDEPTQWREQIEGLQPNDNLDFLVIVANNGQETLEEVNVKVNLPEEIIYQDALQVEGGSYIGDIRTGLNIGAIEPGAIRTIAFKGNIASSLTRTKVDLVSTASSADISVSDAAKLIFKESAVSAAAVGQIFGPLLQYWYLWLLIGLSLLLLLFVGGFYLLYWLIKKRQEREKRIV